MATIFGMRYRCNAPTGNGKCGQLITNAVCDPIEGPNDGVFRTLLAHGLIQQVGSDDGPGQASLYGTAPAFLEQLGLNSLDQLPPIKDYLPEGVDLIELQEQP